jgi:hypothetical protein
MLTIILNIVLNTILLCVIMINATKFTVIQSVVMPSVIKLNAMAPTFCRRNLRLNQYFSTDHRPFNRIRINKS